MTSLSCPKCGGSDYFLSKRNIVKGMGWAQRGSLKSVPVCRVCDEIMDGAQVGLPSWEDLGSPGGISGKTIPRKLWILFAVSMFLCFLAFFLPYDSSFYPFVFVVGQLGLYVCAFLLFWIAFKARKNKKQNK